MNRKLLAVQTAWKLEPLCTHDDNVDESEHVPTLNEKTKENQVETASISPRIFTSPTKLPVNSENYFLAKEQ